MTTSNNLLSSQVAPRALPAPHAKGPLVVIGLLAFLGFADATFLTIKHYTGGAIPCSILNGCDTVTNSIYSQIFGLPVALFGALFYLAVLVLIISYWDKRRRPVLNTIWFFSFIAFLASLVFLYLQVFVIKALCLYCLGSAVTSTLIFLLTSLFARRA